MKRALVVLLALCTFGAAAFAQLSFTGEWSQTIRILPSVGMRSGSFKINYGFAPDWTLTATVKFGYMDQCTPASFGITTVDFATKGALGPLSVDAGMTFNANIQTYSCTICYYDQVTNQGVPITVCIPVKGPDYMTAFFETKLDLAGLSFGLRVDHGKYPYYLCNMPINAWHVWEEWAPQSYFGGCFGFLFPEGGDLDGDGTPYEVPDDLDEGSWASYFAMLYTLTLGISPVSITAHFVDCCTGIEFNDLLLVLDDISLCCGISYDFELMFKKSGFEWARFKIANFLPLCCGITLDLVGEFGIDYKMIALQPKMAGLEFCGEVYYDIPWLLGKASFSEGDGGVAPFFVLNGWKISCTFGDCNSLEIVTVLVPPEDDPKACDAPAWYSGNFAKFDCDKDDLVDTLEWEYVKLSLCGPGCCGGQYKAYFQVWWGQPYFDDEDNYIFSELFGLTRMRGSFTVPVMANLSITGTFTYTLCTKSVTFDLGWKFTF